MPIIQNTQSVRQPESLESIISRIDKMNSQAYQAMSSAIRATFTSTWNHPDYTSTEVITALCTHYGMTPEQLFEIHSKGQDFLALLNPNYQRLTPPVESES